MVRWLDISGLDLHDRFDIFVKYQFARAFLRGRLTDFHLRTYEEHIRVFNSFLEIDQVGTPAKIGAEDFVESFCRLISSIRDNGFDHRHPVPVTQDGHPKNGAHRIAACMALGLPVAVTDASKESRTSWNYGFFRERGMDPAAMDFGALGALDWYDDMRVSVIFGSAFEDRLGIHKGLETAGTTIYEKTLELSKEGQANLIRLIYQGESWLGRAEFGHLGARDKVKPCFPPGAPSKVSLVFFRPSPLHGELAATKKRIRDGLGLGNHSMHVTDTHDEAQAIGDSSLYASGVHLLNHKRYGRFPAFERDFSQLQREIGDSRLSRDDVCIVGSAVMTIYGIRDARDLDLIIRPDAIDVATQYGLKANNRHWESHGFDVRSLLDDPSRRLVYLGITCMRLEDLVRMKRKRDEPKDRVDIALIGVTVGRESAFQTKLARLALLFRLYSNARWLRSYVSHWLVRLNQSGRRRARQAIENVRRIR